MSIVAEMARRRSDRSVRSGLARASVLLSLLLGSCGAAAWGQGNAQVPAPAAAAAGQMVSGRVLSAVDGHPLANARVTLTPQVRGARRRGGRGGLAPDGQPRTRTGNRIGQLSTVQGSTVQSQTAPSQTAQTDAEGRYRVNAPAAGRYTLQATAPGYLAALYLQHEGFSSAIVTGAGLETDKLDFSLLPEASLHGRILDDTGEPVRASVMLYRDADDGAAIEGAGQGNPAPRMAGGTQADEDGQYQFSNLRPGRYYVAVTATPWYAVHTHPQANEDQMAYRTAVDPALDVAYPVTFYPHAVTGQTATPIELKPGSRATANVVMQAEPAMTLTVQLPPSGDGEQGGRPLYPALFSKIFGNEQGVPAAIVNREGDTVQISGLAAGQYAMRSMGRPGLPNAEVPVTLSSGSATVSLPAANQSATDLDLHLHTAGGAPVDDSVSVELRRFGGPGFGNGLSPAKLEQGTAHFVGVPPGQYRILAQQDGEAWTVSRLVVAGKAVSSRVLRVDGSPLAVEVTLSHHLPEIDGVVHAADGKVHAGSLVVLVPAGADAGEDLFRADQSNLDGSFEFASVMPGNYLLVALDGSWKVNWHSSAALMPYLPQAVPVTVPEAGPAVVPLQEAVIAQQNR